MASGDEAIILLVAHPENRWLGTTFRLRAGSVVEIGRGSDCEMSFPEVLSISRHNTRIENDGDRVWIEDLGSINGTAVNDQVVDGRRELRSGDRFQVGAVLFKFLRGDDVEYVYHRTMRDLADNSWDVTDSTGVAPLPPSAQPATDPADATRQWPYSPALAGSSTLAAERRRASPHGEGRWLSGLLGCGVPLALLVLLFVIPALHTQRTDSAGDEVAAQLGDPAKSGGSASIRSAYVRSPDDPETTNDESNDQPLGHFGTASLTVYSYESGNYYTLDGDIDDGQLERLYFPRGGWIDFYDCELDEELQGSCIDEEGRSWEIEGE